MGLVTGSLVRRLGLWSLVLGPRPDPIHGPGPESARSRDPWKGLTQLTERKEQRQRASEGGKQRTTALHARPSSHKCVKTVQQL